jgi:hypothetical protein
MIGRKIKNNYLSGEKYKRNNKKQLQNGSITEYLLCSYGNSMDVVSNLNMVDKQLFVISDF